MAGANRVLDITYPQILGGWIYLTVVPDLSDRKVIGRAFSGDTGTARTTIAALSRPFARRTAREGPVFHSDRGSRCYSKSFPDALGAYCPAVRRSMRREGELSGQRVR
jgi:transposase InsO family protein